ncbi:MAG TPA: hypothetical protein VF503_07215 [Sphingobium sp.]|uniref:hypothetical protein n=1 Tax=Sphingobium sp. TaxID=1912891 RepID=UPI002ED206CD
MWRYEVIDISEQQYRRLRLLIHIKAAEAHLIVRSRHPWPIIVPGNAREHDKIIRADAIN